MTCFGKETFGPVVSLYRFHDEADAVSRANGGDYGLNASIYSQDGARARFIARHIKCGTVNINEAFGATFASLDTPMGGMRESGTGRRQGAEGVLRFTETQSVATQRVMRARPAVRDVRRAVRQGDDRQPAAPQEARSRMSHDVRLRRPGHRLGLRRLGHRAAADREGLPGRRARGRCPVRGRRPARDVVRGLEVPLPARGRLLRHPAHRRAPRLPDRVRRRCRRRLAGLRQHALRAAVAVLRRPAVEPHHRLARGARALLRPGQADARRGREPAPHAVRRRDGEGRHRDGGGRHVPPDPGRRLLRRRGRRHGPDRRRPVLRWRRTRAPDLHRLRLVHDRLPPQRQEHPGQELPPPRRGQRRDGAPAHHGDPGRAPHRRRVRRPRPLHQGEDQAAYGQARADRRAGRLRGVRARHPAAAAPDEGRGAPAAGLRPDRLPLAHQLRVHRRRHRTPRLRRRLQPGHRDHVELPPRRQHPHRAGPLRPGQQPDVAAPVGAHRR